MTLAAVPRLESRTLLRDLITARAAVAGTGRDLGLLEVIGDHALAPETAREAHDDTEMLLPI